MLVGTPIAIALGIVTGKISEWVFANSFSLPQSLFCSSELVYRVLLALVVIEKFESWSLDCRWFSLESDQRLFLDTHY